MTLVHKANILKMTSGLFLQVGREIAQSYPDIEFSDIIVDNCAMQLVRDPTRFDVIVTTNLFGDILSDLTAGLVGGLGVAPGANIGEGAAMFEAVHGTAPDIAGKGIANPIAAMLAGAMMLDRLGHKEQGTRLASAVRRAILLGKDLTPDLGGTGNTSVYGPRDRSSRAQLTGRGSLVSAPRARRGDGRFTVMRRTATPPRMTSACQTASTRRCSKPTRSRRSDRLTHREAPGPGPTSKLGASAKNPKRSRRHIPRK